MRTLRSLSVLAGLATALLLGACGGGGTDTPPPPPTAAPASAPVQLDTARIARATVDTTGGSVTATSADGKRYTLTVPPGALAAGTEITATPVLTMGDAPLAAGLKGAVRFGPAGLRFALPATLRIEGANTSTAVGTTLVGFLRSASGASMQLIPPTVVTGAVEMNVPHFSDVGVSQATANEVSAVPVATGMTPEDALLDEAFRVLTAAETDTTRAAELVRLHDTRVGGRLALAEFLSTSTAAERETAVLVARAWVTMVFFYFGPSPNAVTESNLPATLAPTFTQVRQRVAGILGAQFDAGRLACMAPAPIGTAQLDGLKSALGARELAGSFERVVLPLAGLDAETLARRLNDCVRVVFEPRALPAFETGRQVSLDARAQLIFAADANASIQVPYAFTVASKDGTVASPRGFSDAQGNYTTVVTPVAAQPLFDMQACMVVTPSDGGPVASVLCGRQTLGGTLSSVILAGRVTVNQSSVVGAVDFRVRADVDGTLTVVEALGTVTGSGSLRAQCRVSPTDFGTEITLRRTTVDAVTQGKFLLSPGRPPAITAFGPGVTTSEFLLDPENSCAIGTTRREVRDSDEFGSVPVTAIERGADGLPTAIEFNTNGYSGRLVRE